MHINKEVFIRTTLDLPEKLLDEAMKSSKYKTKTEVIKAALKSFIQQNRVRELKKSETR